jgi:hypothetical protein
MKKAGCDSIFFGVETGSDKIQKSIGKNLKISQTYKIAEICRENKINMHASFILGFPDEKPEDINFTLKCIVNLILIGVVVQVSELTLLPGTFLFNKHYKKLMFDGRFSNFSFTICGTEELHLITNYPKIFSSFYYLPVKTLNRIEMHFLTLFINGSSEFRNTFFLLKDSISNDIKKLNLLELFKTEYKKYQQDKNQFSLSVSFWIYLLKTYLRKNKDCIKYAFVFDVFAYESFCALLKLKFASWQFVKPQNSTNTFSENKFIRPNPIWKIFNTSYELNSILNSWNNWEDVTTNLKKKKNKYLLYSHSEQYSSYLAISQKDEILLQNLIEQPVSVFLKKNKAILPGKKLEDWLIEMNMLGILDFTDI